MGTTFSKYRRLAIRFLAAILQTLSPLRLLLARFLSFVWGERSQRHILVLGLPNAGKSTLLKTLEQRENDGNQVETMYAAIGAPYETLCWRDWKLVAVGLEQGRKFWHIFVWTFDA